MMQPTILDQQFFQSLSDPDIHAKWLNTLAMLENSGARKIAASEDPIHVDLERLSHASEEKRHAYFFKKLISKVHTAMPPDFSDAFVLGGNTSRRLIDKLDAKICRMLKTEYGYDDLQAIKKAAYYLTTYAIEIRAMNIYVPYEEYLQHQKAGFSLRSILLEEEKHLSEIGDKIDIIFGDAAEEIKCKVRAFEATIFNNWLKSVEQHFPKSKA